MQVALIVMRADGERRSFELRRAVTLLGRREDCDLRIPLADVSRKHCRFVMQEESVRLEDLGSSNGTFHNGMRITESELHPGDTVKIGPAVFIVQIDGVPAEDDLSPSALESSGEKTQVPGASSVENLDDLAGGSSADLEAIGDFELQDSQIAIDLVDSDDEPARTPSTDSGQI
jgi:pSer/pThr/pTyr-binding forkhead associated (FHA) protein